MEKSVSTQPPTPLKAADPKEKYTGSRDLSKIRPNKESIRLSGDGIFITVQGEGPTIGYPALFVRLHHCNLACSWCDAYYTWDQDSKEFWTESYPIQLGDLAELLEAQWRVQIGYDGERRVVWTGGEPLIQKVQIDKVMEKLWFRTEIPFWHAEIETNGTLMPTKLQLENFQFNCSPKLQNSDQAIHRMVKPKVLGALTKANTTFKFVCQTEVDLDEIEDLYLPHIDKDKVIIMPEGVIEEEISKHAKQLVASCIKRGFRLLPRLQAIAYDGAKRGV